MLTKITKNDFEFIYGMYMNPAINPFLMYEIMSEQDFESIFDEILSQDIMYIFSVDGQAVGMCKLIPHFHRTSHIHYIGSVAIHPDFGRKGYASLLFEEIIAFGAAKGLKRLELSVATINQKAINLYEKHGFVYEGTLKKYCYLKSEDRYIDEQLMAYLYP